MDTGPEKKPWALEKGDFFIFKMAIFGIYVDSWW